MAITCGMRIEPLTTEEFASLDYRVMSCAYASQNQIGRLADERIYEASFACQLEKLGTAASITSAVESFGCDPLDQHKCEMRHLQNGLQKGIARDGFGRSLRQEDVGKKMGARKLRNNISLPPSSCQHLAWANGVR